MIRRILTLAVATLPFFFSSPLKAQTVSLDENYMSGYPDDLAFAMVQEIVSFLPNEEKLIAQSVLIHVTADGFDRGPATTINGQGRPVIVLPFDFLRAMQEVMVADFLVAYGYLPETFPEEWLSHWVIRRFSQGRYRGEAPLSAVEYAWLTDQERARFSSDIEQTIPLAYMMALTDIILHEIGHHVAEALYDPRAVSSAQARAYEAGADDWAASAFKNYTDQRPELGLVDNSNLLGRFIALTFIRELQSIEGFEGIMQARTHPETGARLERALNESVCDEWPNAHASGLLCQSIRAAAERMLSSNRSQSYYRLHSDAGDAFATYKLAFMRGSSGDYSEACGLFLEAARSEIDERVHHYVGECYWEGFLGQTLNQSERTGSAIFHYCSAARDGWMDSKAEVDEITRITGILGSCSG